MISKPVFERPVLVSDFKKYIDDTSKMEFHFDFLNKNTLEETSVTVPYVHRWHPVYRDRVLARFYKLQEWWISQEQPPVTMMTLTTYQGPSERHSGDTSLEVKGHVVSIDESFKILQSSWRKLYKVLRGRIIGKLFDYVLILENHVSGYPHMHVLLFCVLEDWQKERVVKLWCDKYQAGSREHGACFSDVHTEMRGEPMKTRDDINFIGFYLLKYMGKSFTEPGEMTKGQLIFSAYLWKRGYRQYTTSRNLSKIMKLDYVEDPAIQCVRVRLEGPSLDKEIYELPEGDYNELVQSACSKIKADLVRFGGIYESGI